MKKSLFIVLSTVILLIISKFFFGLYQDKVKSINSQENIIEYDKKRPENLMLIECKKSNNFIYDMQVILDTKDNSQEYYRVIYRLRMTPKISNIYKDITVTAFLDESMKNIFVMQDFLGFGTDIKNKQIIDGIKIKGIEVARATYVNKDLKRDELIKKLTSDIKVKVVWDKGMEWVNISTEDIKFIEE